MEEGRNEEDRDHGAALAVVVSHHGSIDMSYCPTMDRDVPGLPEVRNRFGIPEVPKNWN